MDHVQKMIKKQALVLLAVDLKPKYNCFLSSSAFYSDMKYVAAAALSINIRECRPKAK